MFQYQNTHQDLLHKPHPFVFQSLLKSGVVLKIHFTNIISITVLKTPLPFPALYIPLTIKRSPNKLAPNVLNNVLRNPPFCSFNSFRTVLVNPSINKPESSRDFTILIIL